MNIKINFRKKLPNHAQITKKTYLDDQHLFPAFQKYICANLSLVDQKLAKTGKIGQKMAKSRENDSKPI